MSYPDGGGSAFPSAGKMQHGDWGMTLRDHFAGLAMSAFMSRGAGGDHITIAAVSYRQADAMIAERNKEARE